MSNDLNSTYYSKDGKWCYQISIIDYLQTFDKGKKSEVIAKKVLKRADTSKLSAQASDPYGKRFLNFVNEYVFEDHSRLDKKSEVENFRKSMIQS